MAEGHLLGVYADEDGNPPANPPVITVTETSFSFPNTRSGDFSASQSYDVSGEDLVDDITITKPAGFIINQDDSDTDEGTIILSPTMGSVAPTTIYVKFHPSSPNSYSGQILNQSSGAVTKFIAVAGVAPVPLITISKTSMAFGNIRVGDYSPSQSYVISGAWLSNDIIVVAPADFIVNQDDSNNNESPLTLTHSGGTVGNTTLYVKFHPSLIQNYSTNLLNASTGAVTKSIALTGVGDTPVLYASVGSINGLSYTIGEGPSEASSTFKFVCLGLIPSSGNIAITLSSNLQISNNGVTWSDGPLSLPYVSNTLDTPSNYRVRLKQGLGAGFYLSETITMSGGGANDHVIPVEGEVVGLTAIEHIYDYYHNI